MVKFFSPLRLAIANAFHSMTRPSDFIILNSPSSGSLRNDEGGTVVQLGSRPVCIHYDKIIFTQLVGPDNYGSFKSVEANAVLKAKLKWLFETEHTNMWSQLYDYRCPQATIVAYKDSAEKACTVVVLETPDRIRNLVQARKDQLKAHALRRPSRPPSGPPTPLDKLVSA